MESELFICDELLDGSNSLLTSVFCAPIFICFTNSGILKVKPDDLIIDGDFNETNETKLRNGTITFIKYKNKCYAVTCKHVIEALINKEKIARKRYESLAGDGEFPDFDLYSFYTPIGDVQYHCNYKFNIVPQSDEREVDVAIAEVDELYIKKLGRKPIVFTNKRNIPLTGIASGFPEEQRLLKKGEIINNFSSKFVTCVATINTSSDGAFYLNDIISDHSGVDNLSGMSGGPVVWSDSKKYGLLGIVKEGVPIQPAKDGLFKENSILIHIEHLTTNKLDEWLKYLPKYSKVQDKTIKSYRTK